MADETNKEQLDNPINAEPENHSGNTSLDDGNASINENQKTDNMEIHAHELHKLKGEGWKHYVYEFLMLFLAVFCGAIWEY